jgi:putative transposase
VLVTFQVLYCFFVIEHGRRKILHFNVTRHPTAEWVVQQLREAFSEAASYRYVILDRDAKFDAAVVSFLQGAGLTLKKTSVQSPWQNGIAERWVGSCRRELLDHVIPLHEQHLRRLVRDYKAYYQEDRIHDALGKDTPDLRPVEKKPSPKATLISSERLGGLPPSVFMARGSVGGLASVPPPSSACGTTSLPRRSQSAES